MERVPCAVRLQTFNFFDGFPQGYIHLDAGLFVSCLFGFLFVDYWFYSNLVCSKCSLCSCYLFSFEISVLFARG